MIEVRQTSEFTKWQKSLRDQRARAQIGRRIERMTQGNLGDVKYFGGIGEVRVDVGPGYRVYFAKRGEALIILLVGGDKDSQQRDIKLAKRMAKDLE